MKHLFYFLIISSYLFGFVCIQLGYWPDLVYLTWFQLTLCAVILSYNHLTVGINSKRAFLLFFLVSGLLGFFIEMVGVNTGKIFGNYHYGEVLGWKWKETPLIIGINWFLVSFTANQLIAKRNLPLLVHAGLAAALITALDFLIEPTAVRTGMWSWQDEVIPVNNYIAWFGVSLLISGIYKKLSPMAEDAYSALIWWCMVLFFGLGLLGPNTLAIGF